MSKRKGFTLIELLVVIAIIALLLAILMPALARVRKQAKAVVCQIRLKQWAIIFSAYTGDYNGNLFPGFEGRYDPGDTNYTKLQSASQWVCALRKYYKEAAAIGPVLWLKNPCVTRRSVLGKMQLEKHTEHGERCGFGRT